jgi:DNA-binding Lrp family transcriptional regulator
MSEKILLKIGYYTIYEKKTTKGVLYVADSGKTIYLKNLRKYILNSNRDIKESKSLDTLKKYIQTKLDKKSKEKQNKLSKIPKSLYLVLIKEESTEKTFVKVGITSKRFIMRRFSKLYGYEGYVLESILRRVDTPNAEELEEEIKDKLNKKRSVKKYRPILESFSGYSECFNILGLEDIIKIFDGCVSKQS